MQLDGRDASTRLPVALKTACATLTERTAPIRTTSGGAALLTRTFFARRRRPGMAEKKAKTAEKGGDVGAEAACARACGAESRVVQFTGFGPRGFFWVCEKNCGYTRANPLTPDGSRRR